MGLMHPDLAVRRAGQRMGALMVKALEEQFGDKLTPAERREVARKIIQETFSMAASTPKVAIWEPIKRRDPSQRFRLCPAHIHREIAGTRHFVQRRSG